MKKAVQSLLIMVAFVAVSFTPAHAIFGVGLNWSLDMTTSLDDTPIGGEPAVFDSLKFNVADQISSFGLPSGINPVLTGEDVPINIIRTDFKTTPVNFGAKFYVDILPIIDVEVASNFYMYSYKGSVIYPTGFKNNASGTGTGFNDLLSPVYDTLALQVKLPGVDSLTPYAKLQTDLTIRKTIVKFPPLISVVKFYVGAGPSIIFATPMLSGGMIEDALGESINGEFTTAQLATELFNNDDRIEEIQNYFMEQLFTPHFAFHIIAGIQVKPPIIPLAIYLDTKTTIGGSIDKHVDFGGTNFAVQTGVALAF